MLAYKINNDFILRSGLIGAVGGSIAEDCT